jgi:hypothetical protein
MSLTWKEKNIQYLMRINQVVNEGLTCVNVKGIYRTNYETGFTLYISIIHDIKL